jgi:hypothetical protein
VIDLQQLWPADRDRYETVFKPYCAGKREIFRELIEGGFHPSVMGEIGVGSGVGALQFLQQCPSMSYYGFDNATYGPNGIGNQVLDWASRLLLGFDVHIVVMDTQTSSELPMPMADFFHVDGNHTTKGVHHDLDLVLPRMKTGGYILCDDTAAAEVRAGVVAWLTGKTFQWREFKTLTGDILIKIGDRS